VIIALVVGAATSGVLSKTASTGTGTLEDRVSDLEKRVALLEQQIALSQTDGYVIARPCLKRMAGV
jgi:hypothetical protein